MEIRPLNKGEIGLAKNIDSYCFGHSFTPERIDLFFEKQYDVNNSLAVFEGSQLMSILAVLPFNVRVRGSWLKAGGISSVGTYPEYRGRGYVRKLLFHALGKMKKSGQLISVLNPFEYPFYRKYGWGLSYEKMQAEFSIDKLSVFSGEGYSFHLLSEADIPHIDGVYRQHMESYNAVFMRSKERWGHKFQWQALDRQYRYACRDSYGTVTGVIHYQIKDRDFKIYELFTADRPARHALLHFVYRHRSEAATVSWNNMPLDDPLIRELEDSRIKREIHSNMMARIVDVSRFFSHLSYDSGLTGVVALEIEDPLLVWNRGSFLLHWDNGNFNLEKVDVNMDIKLDISTLSQIAMGYMSPVQAWQAGQLECENEEKVRLFNKIFPPQMNYMNELF